MIASSTSAQGVRAGEAARMRALPRLKIRVMEWLGLAVMLSISAGLNLWNLAQNGYSNSYYAMAVQSMTKSWHNFFFASLDAGGFITVDKPPVGLWMQATSAKIFGFSGLSILVPEALAGVASVAIVYFLVRRVFGPLAGFMAGLALALTPIAVAIDRTNNMDAWLVLSLVLAAWAVAKATERGKFVLLCLAVALVGVGFNIKMLEAFIILPAFYLLYFVGAPISWLKKVLHLTGAAAVLLAVALSWAVAVDLTPASQRPYIGGSGTNSVLALALNYNGLGRITGQGETMGGGNRTATDSSATRSTTDTSTTGSTGTTTGTDGSAQPGFPPNGGQPPSGNFGGPNGNNGGTMGGSSFSGGEVGPLRMFNTILASQWSWLFPLAALGLIAAVLSVKRRWPLDRRGQALMLWGGWLLAYVIVFSMASGIFHPYYVVLLSAPAAALVGIGTASMWHAFKRGGWQAWLLPWALAATAAWEIKVVSDYPAWASAIIPVLAAGTIISVLGLVLVRFVKRPLWKVAPVVLGLGIAALLVAPAAWSVTPVLAVGNSTIPTAGPSILSQGGGGFGGQTMGQGGNSANSSLVQYLQANQDGYFYLVAVSSSGEAWQIAISTGEPVLAMGGFNGGDSAMTVEKLQQMIAAKQIKYVMTGGQQGGGNSNSAVTQWVQSNCTAVSSSDYSSTSTSLGDGPNGMNNNSQLYSCAAN